MNDHNIASDELTSLLMSIIADGFNRSLSALVEAGALDDTRLREHYKGVGSKYYDLVTQQIELTASYGAESIREWIQR